MIQIPDRSTSKMARIKVTTDANGLGTVLLKIPGTNGVMGQRVIKAGTGWFDVYGADDYVKVFITDEDNILGYGAGATIGSYTDTDVPSDNQGWYFPKITQTLQLEKIGSDNARLMSGLYLKIIVQKGIAGIDIFRANIEWGSP